MLEKLKKFKWGYPLLFLILLGIGICLISMKEALIALAITIGCTVAAAGIVIGVFAIAKKERDFNFVIKIIFGSSCLVAGIVTAAFNDASVEILISIFSLLLIIDASFKINTTAMAKRYSVPLWWIILSLATLTVVGGFFLLKYTPEDIPTASLILGIVFIVDALSNLLSAFYVSAYENREKAEHYREFYSKEIAPRAKAALECEAALESDTESAIKKAKKSKAQKTKKSSEAAEKEEDGVNEDTQNEKAEE